MQTVTIGIRNNGQRFINYDYLNTNIPADTDIITITKIDDNLLEKIKIITFDEVQKILSNYL